MSQNIVTHVERVICRSLFRVPPLIQLLFIAIVCNAVSVSTSRDHRHDSTWTMTGASAPANSLSTNAHARCRSVNDG